MKLANNASDPNASAKSSEDLSSADPDSRRIRAELDIQGKLNTIYGLKSQALQLAFKKNKPHLAAIIQNALFGDLFDQDETHNHALDPLLAEGQMDLWKPFFEVIGDEQLKEWLQNPEQAKSLIEAKIAELRHNLERLSEGLRGGWSWEAELLQ
jgi:hypothetical protein